MTKKEAQQRIGKLRKLINRHRYLYHVLDRQEITDAALDSLKKELFDLERQFPEFITSDSPTQRVGGKPLEKFEKAKHPKSMFSFNDAFSEKDMRGWLERISKLLTPEEISQIDFYCELKIDGLAIELIYENQVFKIGSTRGNGLIGENVTQNLKTIEAIPLKLREKKEVITDLKKQGVDPEIIKAIENHNGKADISGKASYNFSKPIIARGEVFISKKEFGKVNKKQKKMDLPTYANPRNLAAGSVRQLDPKITASRHLDSFAYDLISDLGGETHEEKHKILKALGFKTSPHNRHCSNLKEVFKFHKDIQKVREKITYEIDGLVVTVNLNKIFKKLGIVGKAPRGAIAFKFPGKQATTIIENIKVQVGRTGVLTPVAYLKPVQVGGVTVSRATLHNEDEIKKLGVKIGDTVIVGRAGDVIPDIIKVLPELRTGKEKEFKMPSCCPICGGKTVRKKGEVVFRCSNPNCFAIQKKQFHHFVSKGAFDIEGLGPKIVDQLMIEGLVSDPADLFELKEGDLLSLERFAEKSAENLIEAIQSRKEITLPRFIYTLGIRNVGEETAQDLAEHFRILENIKSADLLKLQRVKGIGPVVAESIYNWFCQKRNIKFLEKLKKVGIKIKSQPARRSLGKGGKLRNLTFVLTGVLETMTREEAKEKIEEFEGEVSELVSPRTDFVVVGKKPGSKFEKAKKLGTKTIKEKEFLDLIR